MFNGIFDTGDGIIVLTLPRDANAVFAFRMLATDSGHYMLPTDNPAEQVKEERFLMTIVKDAFADISK